MRHKIAVTAGTLLVMGAAGLAAAQLGNADNQARSDGSFTVVERATSDTTTDTGAPGDSVGDILTFANQVYDRTNRTRVGSDNGYCIRTVKGAAYECQWTLALSGGTISVAGPFFDTRDSVLAITGGTGKWATARGQMRLHARNAAGSAYDFTYSVR